MKRNPLPIVIVIMAAIILALSFKLNYEQRRRRDEMIIHDFRYANNISVIKNTA